MILCVSLGPKVVSLFFPQKTPNSITQRQPKIKNIWWDKSRENYCGSWYEKSDWWPSMLLFRPPLPPSPPPAFHPPILAKEKVRGEDKNVYWMFLITVWFCFDVAFQMIRPKYWLFHLEITLKDWFTSRKNKC